MSLDSLSEIAKVFGVGAALCMVLAAAAYTSVKVLRSDRSVSSLLDRIEEERDYYRDALTREREEARVEREQLRQMLQRQGDDATRERSILLEQNRVLMGQIEMLREEMQVLVMQPGVPGSKGDQGERGEQGEQGIRGRQGEHQ